MPQTLLPPANPLRQHGRAETRAGGSWPRMGMWRSADRTCAT